MAEAYLILELEVFVERGRVGVVVEALGQSLLSEELEDLGFEETTF